MDITEHGVESVRFIYYLPNPSGCLTCYNKKAKIVLYELTDLRFLSIKFVYPNVH